MKEVKGEFGTVDDLEFTNERIVLEDMIIEMGNSPENYHLYPFVMVRFYNSKKEPEYARYME